MEQTAQPSHELHRSARTWVNTCAARSWHQIAKYTKANQHKWSTADQSNTESPQLSKKNWHSDQRNTQCRKQRWQGELLIDLIAENEFASVNTVSSSEYRWVPLSTSEYARISDQHKFSSRINRGSIEDRPRINQAAIDTDRHSDIMISRMSDHIQYQMHWSMNIRCIKAWVRCKFSARLEHESRKLYSQHMNTIRANEFTKTRTRKKGVSTAYLWFEE